LVTPQFRKEIPMRRALLVSFAVFCAVVTCLAETEKPLLLREPSVSRTQIVFSYAGDLWIVGHDGGDAKRLTSGIGQKPIRCFRRTERWLHSRASTTAIAAYMWSPRQVAHRGGSPTIRRAVRCLAAGPSMAKACFFVPHGTVTPADSTGCSRCRLSVGWGLKCRCRQDTQLEKAVQVVLELMKKNAPPGHKQPPYPNYYVTTSAAAK
jgi:hypothetical protein